MLMAILHADLASVLVLEQGFEHIAALSVDLGPEIKIVVASLAAPILNELGSRSFPSGARRLPTSLAASDTFGCVMPGASAVRVILTPRP
jgi:hypothetical protein